MFYGTGQNPSEASLIHLGLHPDNNKWDLGLPLLNGFPLVAISEGFFSDCYAASSLWTVWNSISSKQKVLVAG